MGGIICGIIGFHLHKLSIQWSYKPGNSVPFYEIVTEWQRFNLIRFREAKYYSLAKHSRMSSWLRRLVNVFAIYWVINVTIYLWSFRQQFTVNIFVPKWTFVCLKRKCQYQFGWLTAQVNTRVSEWKILSFNNLHNLVSVEF